MRPTIVLVAALAFAPLALAQEPGGGIAPRPPVRGQIAVSNAMTPAQKIATLEESLAARVGGQRTPDRPF